MRSQEVKDCLSRSIYYTLVHQEKIKMKNIHQYAFKHFIMEYIKQLFFNEAIIKFSYRLNSHDLSAELHSRGS